MCVFVLFFIIHESWSANDVDDDRAFQIFPTTVRYKFHFLIVVFSCAPKIISWRALLVQMEQMEQMPFIVIIRFLMAKNKRIQIRSS